jgi:hypothetical protein
MFVKVENFGIESNFQRGFEKGDMHVVITIESMINMGPMFFHMDSIKNSKVPFKVGALLL